MSPDSAQQASYESTTTRLRTTASVSISRAVIECEPTLLTWAPGLSKPPENSGEVCVVPVTTTSAAATSSIDPPATISASTVSFQALGERLDFSGDEPASRSPSTFLTAGIARA